VLAYERGRKALHLFMEDTVRTRNFALSSALLLPLISAVPAQAQRVSADIIIGGGPVAGRVIIGDQYRGRPRPIREIEWVRGYDYRRDDWWRRFQRESRVIVVYWDRYDDRYYLDRFRGDLVEIVVYERGDRFYRIEDDGRGPRYGDRAYGWYDGRNDHRYDNRPRRPDDRYDNQRWDNRRDDRRWDNRRDDRRWDNRDNDYRDGRGAKDNHRNGKRDNGRRGGDRRGNDDNH